MDEPVNLRVDVSPDQSNILLPGSITISKTTVSVFKLCEASDEEPLFIGVCMIPLLQLLRRRSKLNPGSDTLILMCLSEHLFMNASLSAGIVQTREASENSRAVGHGMFLRTPQDDISMDEFLRYDNPAHWRSIRLEFPSNEACDRCIDALVSRGAEPMASARADTVPSSRATQDGGAYESSDTPRTRSVHAGSRQPTESAMSATSSRRDKDYGGRRHSPKASESDRMRSGRNALLEASHGSHEDMYNTAVNQRGTHTPRESQHSRAFDSLTESCRERKPSAPSQATESYKGTNTPHTPMDRYLHASPKESLPARSKKGESARELYDYSVRQSKHDSTRELPMYSMKDPNRTPRTNSKRGDDERQRPESSVGESQRTPLDSLRESPRELSKRDYQRTPRDSTRESARELSRRESQRTPRDPTRESARELSKRESQRTPLDSTRESPRELSKRESQRTPRDPTRESARELSKRDYQRTPLDSTRESPRELSKRESQRTPRDPTRESARELSKRESQRTPRDPTRESARELSKRDYQRTPWDSTRESARELSNRESQRTPRDSAPPSTRERFYPAVELRELETPYAMSNEPPESAFHSISSPVDLPYLGMHDRSSDLQHTPRSLSRHSLRVIDKLHAGSRAVPSMGAVRGSHESTDASHPIHATSHPYGAYQHSPRNNETPSAARQRVSGRTEHQIFIRGVMKLMHHRLHFMQYLHKEMVHQAYLLEEARVMSGRWRGSGARGTGHRGASVSPRSPRRTAALSGVAEESARLREIERHLRELEELHREAEREREEAVRIRRELEHERITDRVPSPSARNIPAYPHLHDEPEMNDRTPPAGTSGAVPQPNAYMQSRDAGYVSNDQIHSTTASQRNTSANGRVSQMGLVSNGSAINGQVMLLTPQPEDLPVDEADFSTAIVDRYIYGDEWHLLYPSHAVEVRFNALVDVALALKVPRRLLSITNLSVDQPGLRITAEIRHNRDVLPREVLERRFVNQPFRFLGRLYELRHTYANGTSESPAGEMMVVYKNGGRHTSATRNVRRGSQTTTPQGTVRRMSLTNSRQLPSADGYYRMNSAYGDDYLEDELDVESTMRELQRRTDESGLQRKKDLERDRTRKRQQLQQERIRDIRVKLDQLERDEGLQRSRVILAEAQQRQGLDSDGGLKQRRISMDPYRALEEAENVQRAMVEVGYARQAQVIAQAARRNHALARLAVQESERRVRLEETERHARDAMEVMNPKRLPKASSATETEMDERLRRVRLAEAETKQREGMYETLRGFLVAALQDEIEALIGDEKTARIVFTADEMKERIDIVCVAQDSGHGGRAYSRGIVSPQAWEALVAEEAAGREHNVNDERRRRHLFQREYLVSTEDVRRDAIELEELDEHIFLIDDMVHRNRAMLERRMEERKQGAKLANEEQYYRKEVVSDERDTWDMLMEHFDSEMHDVLLAEAAKHAMEQDLESPQRRRRAPGTPRITKSFHYMTFALEDMEHPPSGVLALEGILGCSINKNLEVTSIARPLPKVEEEELQFQAGDMILDVAGFSLHSLSHLREVLANRALQIQQEAREEFADVPEHDLTVNPALQKYIDVLCEHHNFLVQVLRGCDIFQIIVKS